MKFLSILIFSGLMIGCSSSTNGLYYNGGGTQCGDNYNPFPSRQGEVQNSDPAFKKVDLSIDGGDELLPPGTFVYNGMESYFHDSANDFGVHTRDVPDASGNPGLSKTCVRGFKEEKVKNVQFNSKTVTGFKVETDGTISDIKVRSTGFEWSGHLLNPVERTIKVPPGSKFSDLEAQYKMVPTLYKAAQDWNDPYYELRSRRIDDSKDNVQLKVYLEHKLPFGDCPAPGPLAVTENSQEATLPAGTYRPKSVKLYFHGDSIDSGFQVEQTEVKGELETKVLCKRNLDFNKVQNWAPSATVPSSVTVDANEHVSLINQNIGALVYQRLIKVKAFRNDADAAQAESSDTFLSAKEAKVYRILNTKSGDEVYEIRRSLKSNSPGTGRAEMILQLTRSTP